MNIKMEDLFGFNNKLEKIIYGTGFKLILIDIVNIENCMS